MYDGAAVGGAIAPRRGDESGSDGFGLVGRAAAAQRPLRWVMASLLSVTVTAMVCVLAPSASADVVHASVGSASGGLSYQGGPVLHSSRPYLIFWTPSGESIPASSEALMERF